MAKQFAVFDIDGTIVRRTLLQLIVAELVNRGRVDGAAAGDVERILHDGRQRITDDNFGVYMKQGLDMLIERSGGTLSLADYDEAIHAVANSLTSTTYVYTRQLIDTLKKNGFYLIAISGSELRAVQAVATALGFDTCAAHIKYVDDGTVLTGEVIKYPVEKDQVLKAIIKDHGLSTKGSMAVGDTSKDVPMFEVVDQPIAFNPNQELFKVAREKGWMVVLERKDVVYGLQLDNGQYVLKSVNV
jgi:HAD superfamily phosphoserine phosphatase-like hydrolase